MINELPEFSSIKNSSKKKNVEILHINESLIHNILSTICLKIRYKTFFGSDVKSKKKGRIPDLIISDKNNSITIIVELKYDYTSKLALEQCKDSIPILSKNLDLKNVLCIGINVTEDK